MNQKDLIDSIAADTANEGVSKTAAKFVLDALARTVQRELKNGGAVTIPGICILTVKKTTARVGRNPRTGDSVPIPAKTKPVFTATKALKDSLA